MTSKLIGRDHPAGLLRAEIERAATSHGGLVLVTGEAGIGKTTLVTEALHEARRQGALVLSGACWDSASAPGYWPWTQVVRALRRGATAAEWAAAGSGLPVLLGEATDAQPDRQPNDFQLYDAVTTALVTVAQRCPVVVVLDDLHWADVASVRLLEFAAQHTWFERLLLIGTYRDAEVETAEHPLRPLLAALAAKATTVTLTGLDRAEVGRLMAATVGRTPSAEMINEVRLRTGGNPFFVEQTARLWQSGAAVTAIAPGVREAVQRRLSLLPEPVVSLLATAAVLGREFHRQVLAATAAAPVPHVDRLLEQAVAARLVVTLGGGRFAFAHDLVREPLQESLADDEVRRRHAAVVRALSRSPDLASRVLPAELAQHAYRADGEIEPAEAVRYLRAAGEDAAKRMARDEAVLHYHRALERAADVRDVVLTELDLAGEREHWGDPGEARRHYERAIELSRTSGRPELLARVALALFQRGTLGERQRRDLLRTAYLALTGEDPDDPVPLRFLDLAHKLAVKVAGLARSGADEETLTFGLWAQHFAILGMGTAAERETLTEELHDLAGRIGDSEMTYMASSFRWVALLERGDPRYLDAYREFVAAARQDSSPRWAMGVRIDQSIINALRGRFATAESLLDEVMVMSAEHHSDAPSNEFAFMLDHIRWSLRVLQGRHDELAEVHEALHAHEHPHATLLEAISAFHRGDTETALRHLGSVTEPYPPPMEAIWLRFQALTAAASGDPARCEQARAALLPYEGLWALAAYGCDVGGPMDLWLGCVDAAQRRWDDAIRHFTAARESADRLEARPWSALARQHLGAVLMCRGRPGDRDVAKTLLAEAARDAAALEMHLPVLPAPHLRNALAQLGQPEFDGPRTDAPATPDPIDSLEIARDVFRFDGEVWTLGFGGRTVHMPDAKGLRDLHLLLSAPDKEIPAVRLLNPEGGELVVAAHRLGADDVLDEEAKARYKRRLEQLDDEIDRATTRGDDRRAAEYDTERATLLAELRAAAGLAGRTRRLGDEAERARKTVTARIRDTLRKLDHRHPDLATHLRATISTGTTCMYRPDPAPDWRL
jgi:tetratricopeptide (TPR) repeat protein